MEVSHRDEMVAGLGVRNSGRAHISVVVLARLPDRPDGSGGSERKKVR